MEVLKKARATKPLVSTIKLGDYAKAPYATFVRPAGTRYVYSNLNSKGELMETLEMIKYSGGNKVEYRYNAQICFNKLCKKWCDECVNIKSLEGPKFE